MKTPDTPPPAPGDFLDALAARIVEVIWPQPGNDADTLENMDELVARELRAALGTLFDDNGPLIEALAAVEHSRWARWEAWRTAHATPENERRWAFQVRRDYSDLSDDEKESDRCEARISLAVIRRTFERAAP